MTLVIIPFQGPINFAKYVDPHLLSRLVFFGIVATAYIFCNIIPFDKIGRMHTATAVTLIQGATPATIIGAYFMVGEKMSLPQWIGVGCAMVGAAFLSIQVLSNGKSGNEREPVTETKPSAQ